jgi:hypothetical protein
VDDDDDGANDRPDRVARNASNASSSSSVNVPKLGPRVPLVDARERVEMVDDYVGYDRITIDRYSNNEYTSTATLSH